MKNSTAGNSSLKSNPERDENNSPITTGVLLNDDGGLLYEGFLYKGKPCLLGKLFYPDGGIYQEGIFFYKGLIFGKEYYPDGKLRFEGVYEMNYACGPNYPISGRWLSNSGDEEYQGTLKITKSSIGYPRVIEPSGYGAIVQKEKPVYTPMAWEDVIEIGKKGLA